MKGSRYDKDKPEISTIRGDVEYDSGDTLMISPYTDEETESKPTVAIGGQLVNEFQTTIRNFLAAKAQLVIDPPNKSHITVNGNSICHINVATPNNNSPDGFLSGRYFSKPSEEGSFPSKKARSNASTRAVPLSAFTAGVLPNTTPICKFCEKKAQKLHLIANTHTQSATRPGTPIQECPICDKAIKSGYPVAINYQIHHQDFCREVTDSCKEQHDKVDEDTRKRILGKRLSVEKIIEFYEKEIGLSQIPLDDRFIGELELSPPPEIANSDSNISWANNSTNCGGLRAFRYADALKTDDDNNHIPVSGFQFDHPELENSLRILLPEIEAILSKADNLTKSVNGDTYPTNRDVNVTSAPETIINQIGSPELSEQTEHGFNKKEVSTEEIKRSLTALELVSATSDPERYKKSNVDQRVESFYKEYDSLSDVDVTGDDGCGIFHIENQPSRHYHQRLGAYTDTNSVKGCLERLDITTDATALVYGGYTGEFTRKIADRGHTCIFTDPLEDWTLHARNEHGIDETITEPISGIQANAFMRADVVTTFEGYHGIKAELDQGLYDILRVVASTDHGLVFAVSSETTKQMKDKSGLRQFRASYNDLTEIYDLEINRRETDTLRLWQIKQSTDTLRSLEPVLVDLFTIQAIIEICYQTATDLEGSDIDPPDESLVDCSTEKPKWFDSQAMRIFGEIGFEFELGNILEELIQIHPMVSGNEEMVDSIARIQHFDSGTANIQVHNFTVTLSTKVQNKIS